MCFTEEGRKVGMSESKLIEIDILIVLVRKPRSCNRELAYHFRNQLNFYTRFSYYQLVVSFFFFFCGNRSDYE